MIQAELRPNERKKIVSNKNGSWLCECDGNNILYITLIADGYPERLGYAYINELRQAAGQISNYYGMTPAEFERAFQSTFEASSTKYNDPNSIDKLSSVNSKVDLASAKMQDNIKKALENQQDLNNVNTKTEAL